MYVYTLLFTVVHTVCMFVLRCMLNVSVCVYVCVYIYSYIVYANCSVCICVALRSATLVLDLFFLLMFCVLNWYCRTSAHVLPLV